MLSTIASHVSLRICNFSPGLLSEMTLGFPGPRVVYVASVLSRLTLRKNSWGGSVSHVSERVVLQDSNCCLLTSPAALDWASASTATVEEVGGVISVALSDASKCQVRNDIVPVWTGRTKWQLSNNRYTFLKLLRAGLGQDNRSLGCTEIFWMCKMRSESRKHDKFVKEWARVFIIMGPPIGASRRHGGAWGRVRSV